MSVRRYLPTVALVAVCFLYTGSVYMSQFLRSAQFFDAVTVDIITSVLFYLLQALGIGLYMLGLLKQPRFFASVRLFVVLLISGALWMVVAQVTTSTYLLLAASLIFNLHIGFYFGFYLVMFAQAVPVKHAGLAFGCAYALGSLGTYIFSLLKEGTFLVSKEILVLYLLLVSLTIASAIASQEIVVAKLRNTSITRARLNYIVPIVILMTIISVMGSELYYSLPSAEHVNWNLIRAFYALGLVMAGLLMDTNRFLGNICAIASLTYPLIATSLVGEGLASTTAMSLSYLFRGFVTLYYILAFSSLYEKSPTLLVLAPLGLAISRVSEALVTWVLMSSSLSSISQLVFAAACFIPLLVLFAFLERETRSGEPISAQQRLAQFADDYALTAREAEILKKVAAGLSDNEIADELFISRNTVRFHVSNVLKKTGSRTRVEATRKLTRN